MPAKQYDPLPGLRGGKNGHTERNSTIPPCTLRTSCRKNRVTLTITRRDGLVLVAPEYFDTSGVPEILERRTEWILRTIAAMQAKYPDFDPWNPPTIPPLLDLRCLEEQWQVDTVFQSAQKNPTLRINAGHRLLLRLQEQPDNDQSDADQKPIGLTDANLETTRLLLNRFLVRKAKPILPDILAEAARETGLHFSRCQIRTQSTRWGSCSTRGGISLNAKLLFMPRHLVRYICIHELCHTQQLNHGPKFHKLVRQMLPEVDTLEKELHSAEALVPRLLA